MKILLSGVYAGYQERKDGKKTVTIVENGKIRKISSKNVKNGFDVGALVDVEVDGVSSIFANYGDLNINAELVELHDLG